MNVQALRTDELTYELRFRNIDTDGLNVDQKRKLLRTKLAIENANPSVLGTYEPLEYDLLKELDECKSKLDELSDLANEYIANPSEPKHIRLFSRLTHLLTRLYAIKPGDELLPQFSVLISNCLETIERINECREAFNLFDDKVQCESDHSQEGYDHALNQLPVANSTSKPRVSFSDILPPVQDEHHSGFTSFRERLNNLRYDDSSAFRTGLTKPVPVSKWGLTFTGDDSSMGLCSFLQRVEELRVARHVSTADLFASAVDLFSGRGLVWFRSVRSEVSSWEELIHRLRYDFLPSDYDEELWGLIKERRQGSSEKACLYIASMINLFDRLIEPPSPDTRLKYILRNLQPFFTTSLALIKINSIDHLRQLCKCLEETKLWNSRFNENSISKSALSIEPELLNPQTLQKPNVHLIEKTRKSISTPASKTTAANRAKPSTKCYNCQSLGHSFHTCLKPLKTFCFVCGKPDVTYSQCGKCSPKNGERRGDDSAGPSRT